MLPAIVFGSSQPLIAFGAKTAATARIRPMSAARWPYTTCPKLKICQAFYFFSRAANLSSRLSSAPTWASHAVAASASSICLSILVSLQLRGMLPCHPTFSMPCRLDWSSNFRGPLGLNMTPSGPAASFCRLAAAPGPSTHPRLRPISAPRKFGARNYPSPMPLPLRPMPYKAPPSQVSCSTLPNPPAVPVMNFGWACTCSSPVPPASIIFFFSVCQLWTNAKAGRRNGSTQRWRASVRWNLLPSSACARLRTHGYPQLSRLIGPPPRRNARLPAPRRLSPPGPVPPLRRRRLHSWRVSLPALFGRDWCGPCLSFLSPSFCCPPGAAYRFSAFLFFIDLAGTDCYSGTSQDCCRVSVFLCQMLCEGSNVLLLSFFSAAPRSCLSASEPQPLLCVCLAVCKPWRPTPASLPRPVPLSRCFFSCSFSVFGSGRCRVYVPCCGQGLLPVLRCCHLPSHFRLQAPSLAPATAAADKSASPAAEVLSLLI